MIALGMTNPRKLCQLANRFALGLKVIWEKGERIGSKPWLAKPLVLLIALAEDAPEAFRRLRSHLTEAGGSKGKIPQEVLSGLQVSGHVSKLLEIWNREFREGYLGALYGIAAEVSGAEAEGGWVSRDG